MIKMLKVSDKGQIAIPQQFRESMGIKRGDNLIVLEVAGKLLIEKQENISNKMKDDFKDIIQFSENSLKEVWDNPEDEVWNSYLKK